MEDIMIEINKYCINIGDYILITDLSDLGIEIKCLVVNIINDDLYMKPVSHITDIIKINKNEFTNNYLIVPYNKPSALYTCNDCNNIFSISSGILINDNFICDNCKPLHFCEFCGRTMKNKLEYRVYISKIDYITMCPDCFRLHHQIYLLKHDIQISDTCLTCKAPIKYAYYCDTCFNKLLNYILPLRKKRSHVYKLLDSKKIRRFCDDS